MGNCLITKLKGTVKADLPVFGEEIIHAYVPQGSSSANRQVSIYSDVPITLRIISGGPFYNAGMSASIGNVVELPAQTSIVERGVRLPDGDTVFSIKSKYGITGIRIPLMTSLLTPSSLCGGKVTFCYQVKLSGAIEDYKFSDNLETLLCDNGTTLTGNIDSLAKYVNATSIGLPGNVGITGSIESFVSTNLLSLGFPGCPNVNGNIASMVQNLPNIQSISLGETNITGDISALLPLQNLTHLSVQRCPNITTTREVYNTFVSRGIKLVIEESQIID